MEDLDIDTRKKIREFYRFLIETQSLLKFFYNLGKMGFEYIAFVHYTPPESFIMNSFNWHTTPEGSTYWMNLHIKWIKNHCCEEPAYLF